jgi:carbonic anhydrase
MADVMDGIRKKQKLIALRPPKPPELHRPKMLYIGCIDARLDPIDDIGIPKGDALIYRNIAALVTKNSMGDAMDESKISPSGEIPQSVSVGAVLEFYLNHIPHEGSEPRHIVIAGHTDCGGLKACRHGQAGEHDQHLPLYLENLKDVRAAVMEKAREHGWDQDRILTELEEESVRMSVANLKEYPAVRKALENGTLVVHGWVLDTGSQRIREMDMQSKKFAPMNTEVSAGHAASVEAGQQTAVTGRV